MKIAMLGTRGIPASYSGFETCVEELGSRLVERGHQVTVYCRSHHITYPGKTYRGMNLVKLPTLRNKYLDTIVHSALSALHVLGTDVQVALFFIAGNSPVCWIPRLGGKKVILNVDGLDWKRDKWPAPAKKYIQFAEYLATKLPHVFVTDSRVVQQYYARHHRAEARYIPYGSEVAPLPPGPFLKRYGLEPRRYFLFVGRLVPENCAHHLVDAYKLLDTDMKCVIVGDAPYAEGYIASLKTNAGEGVIFTGYLFDEGYRELSTHPYAFVETSGVGGTHPALLEAMGLGNCVVVHDTAENLETIGDAGLSYAGRRGGEALAGVLYALLNDPKRVAAYRQRAGERVRRYYTWDRITDAYEGLFEHLLERGGEKT